MILLYRTLTTILYPIIIIYIFLRKMRKKEDPKRYKEKILISNFNVNKKNNLKLIWFHAASIGELKSIIPIIEVLNNKNINLEFLITTITVSSSNLAKIELKKFDNAYHRFLPVDVNFLIKKFLQLWKPDAIFLVDSEIWPNLILSAKDNKVPLILINARLTFKSFKKWNLILGTAKKIFSSFDLCLASNIETKNFLKILNAKNIIYTGNIKLLSKIDQNQVCNLNEKILSKNKFWLAASTHQGEEIFCLKTHVELKKSYNNTLTIIAPRHIERSAAIKSLCDKLNLKSQILNKNETIQEGFEVIIINSFGILSNYLRYAKSVFIGKSMLKSLEKVGGQNPIDAAKLGCKIYHGPYIYNFKEVYEILEKNNVSKRINNHYQLTEHLIADLENNNKDIDKFNNLKKNLEKNTLDNTLEGINKYIFNDFK